MLRRLRALRGERRKDRPEDEVEEAAAQAPPVIIPLQGISVSCSQGPSTVTSGKNSTHKKASLPRRLSHDQRPLQCPLQPAVDSNTDVPGCSTSHGGMGDAHPTKPTTCPFASAMAGLAVEEASPGTSMEQSGSSALGGRRDGGGHADGGGVMASSPCTSGAGGGQDSTCAVLDKMQCMQALSAKLEEEPTLRAVLSHMDIVRLQVFFFFCG